MRHYITFVEEYEQNVIFCDTITSLLDIGEEGIIIITNQNLAFVVRDNDNESILYNDDRRTLTIGYLSNFISTGYTEKLKEDVSQFFKDASDTFKSISLDEQCIRLVNQSLTITIHTLDRLPEIYNFS